MNRFTVSVNQRVHAVEVVADTPRLPWADRNEISHGDFNFAQFLRLTHADGTRISMAPHWYPPSMRFSRDRQKSAP